MAVDVHDSRTVLLCARGDQQIGQGDTMVADRRELAVGGERRRERLGVHSQVAKQRDIVFEALVVGL